MALDPPKNPAGQDALGVLPDRFANPRASHTAVRRETELRLGDKLALSPTGLEIALETLVNQDADNHSGFPKLAEVLERMTSSATTAALIALSKGSIRVCLIAYS